jgi:pyruvate/2-oxoglutarate dehydrogenase complex dihydrolipoamide dehydrogenase (E3) component
LPGIEKGSVYSVEAVMARRVRPGKRVLLLDEGGGWRGCGTALKLGEEGHEVTLLSPDAFIGKELQRTTADVTLRKTLSRLGVKWHLEVSVAEWHGNGATILCHNTDEKTLVEGDCLGRLPGACDDQRCRELAGGRARGAGTVVRPDR